MMQSTSPSAACSCPKLVFVGELSSSSAVQPVQPASDFGMWHTARLCHPDQSSEDSNPHEGFGPPKPKSSQTQAQSACELAI